MSYTDQQAISTFSFDGQGHTCHPARCAKGKMALCITEDGGFKTRGAYLAEALNGRWTGRDRGYLLSPKRATLWRRLYMAGFDASLRIFEHSPAKFHHGDRRDMTEREAVALLATLSP